MCWKPINVKDHNNVTQQAPCGKCEQCIKRKISAWSFRLMNEDRYSTSAHFITLTYDDKHCPISKKGWMQLQPDHIKNYFKRLRTDTVRRSALLRVSASGRITECHNRPIKYYAVGEYGARTRRPHYHALIFNADITLLSGAWRCTTPECGCGKLIGQLHYGTVSGASVGYTMKYMSKPWKPMHSNDDRQPQFARMSKHLGINYLTPQMLAFHKADLENNMYLTVRGTNKKIAMPRYYKDKIYTSEERGLLKGYFEQKLLDKDYEAWQKNTGKHSPGYVQAVESATRRMYYASSLQTSI